MTGVSRSEWCELHVIAPAGQVAWLHNEHDVETQGVEVPSDAHPCLPVHSLPGTLELYTSVQVIHWTRRVLNGHGHTEVIRGLHRDESSVKVWGELEEEVLRSGGRDLEDRGLVHGDPVASLHIDDETEADRLCGGSGDTDG